MYWAYKKSYIILNLMWNCVLYVYIIQLIKQKFETRIVVIKSYTQEEHLIQIINNVNIFICLSPTHDVNLTDLSHQSISLHLQVINVVILPKSLKLKSINCVFDYKMNRGLEACFIVIILINSRINIINLMRERHFPTRHDWK